MMTETVVNVQNVPPNSNVPNKSSDNALGWIKLNVDYFRTVPGILKLVELFFGILCMSLASTWLGGTHFFLLVVCIAFIGTLIWVIIYFLGIRETITNFPINWIATELLNTGICTLFYFIAFIVQLSVWSPVISYYRGTNIAAGVFGLFNTICYGFGTYLLFIESRSPRS